MLTLPEVLQDSKVVLLCIAATCVCLLVCFLLGLILLPPAQRTTLWLAVPRPDGFSRQCMQVNDSCWTHAAQALPCTAKYHAKASRLWIQSRAKLGSSRLCGTVANHLCQSPGLPVVQLMHQLQRTPGMPSWPRQLMLKVHHGASFL